MKLNEIGIGNFASIGEDPVWVNLEKKLTIYIGANNSGKSNVLRAFEWLSKNRVLDRSLKHTEIHGRDEKNLLRISFKASFEKEDGIPEITGKLFAIDFKVQGNRKEFIAGPLDSKNICPDIQAFNKFFTKHFNKYFPQMPSIDIFNKAKLDIHDAICREILSDIPETSFIPQFRQIIPGSDYAIKGDGIVEMLAKWQHPEITADQNIRKFHRIRDLLRRLLNLSDIELEIVHTKDQIIVNNKGLRLPLESYGTGIHELIILAAAVYSRDNIFFLIEEPEIHLHPTLQKEFLNFLLKETSNHYLITTHSNSLIQPSKDVDVIHLKLSNNSTQGRRVESAAHVLEILTDLGIKPSDILQANSVIWVEGPSDRIYVNRWIKHLYPDLIEGVDYSAMFYGGKLLSHLCMEREMLNPSELIQLLRINQRSLIIIDSDRKQQDDDISETKKRIKSECEKNDIYCWITDGREIENYLSNKSISLAYSKHTGIEINLSISPYDHLEDLLKSAYGDKWENCWSYNSSKPSFARMIIQHLEKQGITLELKEHLAEVSKIISSRH